MSDTDVADMIAEQLIASRQVADRAEEHAREATEEFRIGIFRATRGMGTRELAERLGRSQTTISRWASDGQEALERREKERDRGGSGDPERSGERGADG